MTQFSALAADLLGDPSALAEAQKTGYGGRVVIARDLDVLSP